MSYGLYGTPGTVRSVCANILTLVYMLHGNRFIFKPTIRCLIKNIIRLSKNKSYFIRDTIIDYLFRKPYIEK